MKEDVRRAKKLLESKGYLVEKQLLFEGLDESDVVPLHEFIENNGRDSAWEDTLEESLAELSGNQLTEYKVGDIIMPKTLYSPMTNQEVEPHKILLIQTMHADEEGIISYRGFLLSSKYEKSNKYGRYPNNIYIDDYATILYRGTPQHKKAYIRVDDIVEFTNADLDTSGVWKGTVSNKFFRFVNNCYNNYKNGISNANKYWISERSHTNGRSRQETT